LVLRRAFYPDATGLGRTVERVHGTGTPAEVLDHLPGPAGPGASMLHLGCALGGPGGLALELAGEEPSARLTIARILARAGGRGGGGRGGGGSGGGHTGGVLVLPADSGVRPIRAAQFTDGLLEAGMTGAVCWLWPVPEPVASVMYFVLHAGLVDDGLSPAVAVQAVHRWMLDRERAWPPHLPASFAAAVADTDLAEPRFWAAMCHRGR
jgi:hypothetical protein